MKRKMILSVIIAIATYLIFIYNFNLEVYNDRYSHKIKYNGLLWVVLDNWSIKTYKSNDVPMKWIEHTYTKKK